MRAAPRASRRPSATSTSRQSYGRDANGRPRPARPPTYRTPRACRRARKHGCRRNRARWPRPSRRWRGPRAVSGVQQSCRFEHIGRCHVGHISACFCMIFIMVEPLTDEELAELEAEAKSMAQWALDEDDVRRLQLRRTALAELRSLREEILERRAAEVSMRQHLEYVEHELAQVKRRR